MNGIADRSTGTTSWHVNSIWWEWHDLWLPDYVVQWYRSTVVVVQCYQVWKSSSSEDVDEWRGLIAQEPVDRVGPHFDQSPH